MNSMSHDLRNVDASKGNILCKPVQGNRPVPAPGTFAEPPLRRVRPMPVMPRYREGSADRMYRTGKIPTLPDHAALGSVVNELQNP
eukprot:CAMPEP_0183437444 /NCGR_PEP_ID=MMETSP0370-20130417/72957_1 /TAXON_ID=268820 /ORGANISM="Peridinium aciculiferum, Strain PAER-2" /LENGTH=85 /DNA_ID=CAMNT_0025625233 /DNA_START=20 /DNA_END=275 /DNA_ORIENTATION=+